MFRACRITLPADHDGRLSFNAIFGLIPDYVSLNYPSNATAMIFGIGNVMLGLGAMKGNFLGGVIKDESGSFQLIYIAAAALAVLLVLIASFLKTPKSQS
ncbi:hypothetical protein GFM13_21160 [Rhizobium leguminosarum bv. viciae]|nr:hypothetical protein [Rhizobium leguminosarum bv. viciae]